MPLFLLRTIETHDVVGIFNADTVRDFLISIDECINAEECECLELPAGGLFWTSPTIQIPVREGDNDNGSDLESGIDIPWATAEMSGSWFTSFYSEQEDWFSVSAVMDHGALYGLVEDNFHPDPPPKPKLRVVRKQN